MPPQISKCALKLTEKARAAAKDGVILVSQKRKGSNSSVANADTSDTATHMVTKVPAKKVKANPTIQCNVGSNPVLNVQVQQEVVVINSDIGSCKSSSHGQEPPNAEEESSDVELVEPEEEETAEDELSMPIKLQNISMH